MFAVTYGDDGYVAVGVIDGPSGHTGAIWHSVDGLAWTLIEGQPDLHGGGGVFIEDVTGVDGGYLAVGSQRTAIGVGEDGQPLASEAAAMWFSPNGTQWTRLPDDGVFAPNGEQVTLRNVGADGLRIVDYREEPADAPPPEDPDAVEWVGRIWYGSLS